MKHLRKQAFTLIEVMVVLSILAIVAILSYNFFGSIVKDATLTAEARELFRQMQLVEDSYLTYIRKTGQAPPFTNNTERANFRAAVVDLGILKEFPMPPEEWKNPNDACTTATSAGGAWGWTFAYTNRAGSPADELMFYTFCLKKELCEKFNELYTTPGTTIADSYHTVISAGGRICTVPNGAPDNQYMAYGLADIN